MTPWDKPAALCHHSVFQRNRSGCAARKCVKTKTRSRFSEPALWRAGGPHGLRQQERYTILGVVDRDVDLKNPADGFGRDCIGAAAVDRELAAMQQHDAVGEAHREVEVV